MSCHFAVVALRRLAARMGVPTNASVSCDAAPDWSAVHATMLSIQHVLGLPRFLVPSTRPGGICREEAGELLARSLDLTFPPTWFV